MAPSDVSLGIVFSSGGRSELNKAAKTLGRVLVSVPVALRSLAFFTRAGMTVCGAWLLITVLKGVSYTLRKETGVNSLRRY